jgi:hypothetical protein
VCLPFTRLVCWEAPATKFSQGRCGNGEVKTAVFFAFFADLRPSPPLSRSYPLVTTIVPNVLAS